MHVEYKQEGGFAAFPGLSKPFVIETGDLPAEQSERLQELLEASNFFKLPIRPTIHPGAADYITYIIMVVDGRRRRTVRLVDPIEDPHVQNLIDFLNDLRRAAT